jgi:hypothetical protein
MATNFPTSLDTSVTLPAEASTTSLSVNHVTSHQNVQDAIEAIEAKLGVNSSAVTTSHDYKLSEVTGSDKAVGKTATQTLTNKTLTSPTITGATLTTSTVNGVTITTAGSVTDFLAANGTYQTGAVANASTTVKGISELATSSEITAGTATGGTGAALVVTPDALAASTPVFDGSGLTSVTKVTTAPSAVTVGTSSTAENTLLSYALAGGILSTSNAVIVKAYLAVTSSGVPSETITVRFKYGATTLFSPTFAVTTSNLSHISKIEFSILSAGTTGTQTSDLFLATSASSPATTNTVSTATSSEDSTTSKNIIITAQSGASDANLTITIRDVVITRIK